MSQRDERIRVTKRGTDVAVGGSSNCRDPWGSGGEASSRWASFVIFFEKNSFFNAIWITFCAFLEPCKKAKLLKMEVIYQNEISRSSSPLPR